MMSEKVVRGDKKDGMTTRVRVYMSLKTVALNLTNENNSTIIKKLKLPKLQQQQLLIRLLHAPPPYCRYFAR